MTKKNEVEIKAYMAGPDVFHPDAKINAEVTRLLCEQHGIVALIPLDNEVSTDNTPSQISQEIYEKNTSLMDSADLFIVNMTPFRGPSTDVGTAFEMGYAAAQKKKVFAFTSDLRTYKERVEEFVKKVGSDGQAVEDFGNVDNTMLDKSVVEIKSELAAVLESPKFKSVVFMLRKQKEELMEKNKLDPEHNQVKIPRPEKVRSLKP